ncbi:MAG: DUF4349 domain-containing protein [Chloroflexi bacterium]|nr:DUF4349 domain-containing protein [Chloroflexota bacterium]
MKAKTLFLASFSIFAIVLAACGASPQTTSAPSPQVTEKMVLVTAEVAGKATYNDAAGANMNAAATDFLQQERKVVYNARLTLVVKDTAATAQQIEELTTATGGYIANMNAYRSGDDQLYYNITLRIPVSGFDSVRDALRNMAVRVDNDQINTDDVTDQYYDLDAHLRTLRATADELISLLQETRQRGGQVEDIMSIYRELTNIQSQIESLQGQLNRLDKLTAYSTISIDMRPDELTKPIKSSWRPLETLRNSFRVLIDVLQSLVDVLIYLIVVILPTLIILAIPVLVVIFALRWLINRIRKTRAPKAE